ncbi:TetR/AcrR family transcriptional regulator [Nocardia sp. NPDC057227]|uniref:TetR/AcrR family transcriptional regulator n=1 Tax=Nocardia sp. NPDC057227 TaxID=3346056 RepID=UPI0036288D57
MTVTRGRIDKRRAILDAAFSVFALRGYDQACVQEIASAAGVAKPTVYNHLSDKATLFHSALRAAAEEVTALCAAAVEPLRDAADVPAALAETAALLLAACSDERSRALRKLALAESTAFPDLLDEIQEATALRLRAALADRLARLTLAGRLRTPDPDIAAEQLIALLTGPLESRSRMGRREVPAAELDTIATAAVRTFLSAFGTPGETARSAAGPV